jgi:hypothetical protein
VGDRHTATDRRWVEAHSIKAIVNLAKRDGVGETFGDTISCVLPLSCLPLLFFPVTLVTWSYTIVCDFFAHILILFAFFLFAIVFGFHTPLLTINSYCFYTLHVFARYVSLPLLDADQEVDLLALII